MRLCLIALSLWSASFLGGCTSGPLLWQPASSIHTAVWDKDPEALRRMAHAHPLDANRWARYQRSDEPIGYVTPISLAAYLDWPEGIDVLVSEGGEVNPTIAADDAASHRPPL